MTDKLYLPRPFNQAGIFFNKYNVSDLERISFSPEQSLVFHFKNHEPIHVPRVVVASLCYFEEYSEEVESIINVLNQFTTWTTTFLGISKRHTMVKMPFSS